MAYPQAPVPPVQDYMFHYAATKNDLFDRDYKVALSPYLIDVANPTNTPGPADISQHIYAADGDAPTAFMLLMDTPGLTADYDPDQIVLLHSISQFSSRLVFPVTKWDTK